MINCPIYLINLINRPNRLINSLKELNKVSMAEKITRINATNKEEAYKVRHKYFDSRIEDNIKEIKSTTIIPTWGAAGCAISHIRVWREILNNNIEFALILEDDNEITDINLFNYSIEKIKKIYFSHIDKKNTPFFASLISKTPNKYSVTNIKDVYDYKHFFTGTSFYFVNNRFCNLMLEDLNRFPLLYQIDIKVSLKMKEIYSKTYLLFNTGVEQSKKYISDNQYYFIKKDFLIKVLLNFLPVEMIERIHFFCHQVKNLENNIMNNYNLIYNHYNYNNIY